METSDKDLRWRYWHVGNCLTELAQWENETDRYL
jgi:hypothetical protein